jgi:hypothetical protein
VNTTRARRAARIASDLGLHRCIPLSHTRFGVDLPGGSSRS